MSSNEAVDDMEPRYPGEDCRPTSRKELFGFYACQCAIEVVVIAGVGSFLPITLEELARGNGVLLSDRVTPCNAARNVSVSGSEASRVLPRAATGDQCIVTFLGTEINTASFAMYTFSVSVALQALIVITMSGAADHGRYRKSLLLSFAVVGAVALMCFLPLHSSVYALGALLAITANVCLGAATVLMNAYLPLLVRWHPTVLAKRVQHTQRNGTSTDGQEVDVNDPDDGPASERRGFLSSTENNVADAEDDQKSSTELRVSTHISSNGYGFGYINAFLFQLFCIGLILLAGPAGHPLPLVLFAIGVWWLIIIAPVAYCLRPRPGPPLSRTTNHVQTSRLRAFFNYTTYSWKQLGHTMLRARKSKDLLLFLAAWFMISDAVATVSGTAILFAKTSLHMGAAALSMISVTTTVFGIIGAFSCNKVTRALGWTPTRTLVACICLFELIPLYGLLPYIPAVARLGVIGLQRPWETYLLGAIYGLVLGGVGSFSRSLFGELVPPGSEAAFYALYAVTDKGSSVVGPTIVGMITDATGEIRPGFLFLAFLVALPLWPLAYVDIPRGKRQAKELADKSVREVDVEDD